MKVTELNREQLVELKQAMLSQSAEQPSYGELAMADELIPDEQVYDEYAGTEFTEDDFSN